MRPLTGRRERTGCPVRTCLAPGSRYPRPRSQEAVLKGSEARASLPCPAAQVTESFLCQEMCVCVAAAYLAGSGPTLRGRERSPVGRWGFPLQNRWTTWTKVCGLKMTNGWGRLHRTWKEGCPRDQPEPCVPSCLDTLASSVLFLRAYCIQAGSEAQSGCQALTTPSPLEPHYRLSKAVHSPCLYVVALSQRTWEPGQLLGSGSVPGVLPILGRRVSLGQTKFSPGHARCSTASARQLGQRQCFRGQSYTLTHPVLV